MFIYTNTIYFDKFTTFYQLKANLDWVFLNKDIEIDMTYVTLRNNK